MPISEIPLLSMLKNRMYWHQERQLLLAQNVANADMPHFRPLDLAPPEVSTAGGLGSTLGLTRTDPGHIAALGFDGSSQFSTDRGGSYEVRPSGNSVNVEDEMTKVAGNQMDYQTAATLYSHGLNLIKTALGKG